ncbi:transposase [Nonomuraea sp. NPDC049141]|uniref:transposase n=1 Tax=Nonomuraea sp. NPDC049141 TaxID=3155500 RepID=UPI0033C9D402
MRIDDALKAQPHLAPWRPKVGIAPTLGDAELVTSAVLSALLGFISERRWLRHARAELSGMFPYLPGQPGYNRRLRNACDLVVHMIRMLAGWAEYGYCASRSRYFWGLRLHLLCTLGGLPVLFALSGAKADEREVLLGMLHAAPDVLATHPQQTIIADRQYYGRSFERDLTERELRLLRPARRGEPERPGAQLLKPRRQSIESINQTFKGQLDLERHGGRTQAGVIIRVLARILALTTVIWLNDKTGQPIKRSLIAYDH